MGNSANIYGLDIEIDTRRGGLDPAVSTVLTVALCGPGFDDVFIGDEFTILRGLDTRLAALPAGVLATWNGATFDLPFIADRARILGLELDLQLFLDRRLTLNRAPLPGHAGAYRGAWGHHAHLDTFRLYGGGVAGSNRMSLKTLGRLLGFGCHGGPADPTHDLANEALHANAASDARLARVLAQRRWNSAFRLIDRLDHDEAPPTRLDVRRPQRQARAEGQPFSPVAAGI